MKKVKIIMALAIVSVLSFGALGCLDIKNDNDASIKKVKSLIQRNDSLLVVYKHRKWYSVSEQDITTIDSLINEIKKNRPDSK